MIEKLKTLILVGYEVLLTCYLLLQVENKL